MRRVLSILLLVAFGLPFLSPLFALSQSADAGLPACCRRSGAHHCAVGVGPKLLPDSTQLQAPDQKCPYSPASLVSVHLNPLSGPETSQAIFAGIVSHPAIAPQTESKRRIAQDHSRQKRGPPTTIPS